MSFQRMTADVDNISRLKDRPSEDPGGISSEQLKAKFDEAPLALQSFINSLIDALNSQTAAANIGAKRGEASSTVQIVLDSHDSRITSLENAEYTIPDGAVTAAKIAANAVSTVYSGTLTAAGWEGSGEQEDEAPFTQAVSIEGILADDEPIIDLTVSATYSTAMQEEEAWAEIYKAVASAGAITFYAKTAPTVALGFKARCVRK